jgi:hypothetical protein
MKKKLIIGGIGAAAAVLAVATPASAFHCYNAMRSAQGNVAAAKSGALMSFSEILGDPEVVGLCPEGVDFVIAGTAAAGYETDQLVSFRSVMAQGLERSGDQNDLLHDGKGIDHLSDEFFETVDPLIEDGFGICFGG